MQITTRTPFLCAAGDARAYKGRQCGTRQMSAPPGLDGLHVGLVDGALADACLAEVLPLLDAHGRRTQPGRSEMLELGCPSSRASPPPDDGVAAEHPHTGALIAEAMRVLPKAAKASTGGLLNVIVRRYRAGEGLVFHVDYHGDVVRSKKYHAYDEPVYGCVLENTSDGALTFKHGRDAVVRLPERKGTVFLQTGHARFACRHGLPPLTTGERVSITWRWVVPP